MTESSLPHGAITMINFREQMAELNPDAIAFDDLDSAIIGIGRQWGGDYLFIYSADKLIEALMDAYDMDWESATEWYGANVECLYAGPGTPIIVDDMMTDG